MNGSYKAILTFDDGPMGDEGHAGASLKMILETLKQRGAPSVFYVLGEEVKKNPALTKSILEGGHIVQSHSWSHRRLPDLSETELTKDLQDTQKAIHGVTGKTPTRLRPPYGAGWVGKKSDKLISVSAKLNLTLTGWDIDTNDWNSKNTGLKPEFFSPARQQWKKLHDEKQSPLDILMHVKMVTARALGDFMDGLIRDGWRFATYPDDAAKDSYQIQIFAGSKAGALKKAREADSAGFTNVRVLQDSILYKVRVGPYRSRSAADSALKVLTPRFNGSFVVGGGN